MINSSLLLAQKYSGIGSIVLVADGKLIIFGDEKNKDLIAVAHQRGGAPNGFFRDGVETGVTEELFENLTRNVRSLNRANVLASFAISSSKIKAIRELIIRLDATHLRLHSHLENIRITVFNCRLLDGSIGISRKKKIQVKYLEFGIRPIAPFSITIKSSSFKKLPILQDYSVWIGNNEISEWSPVQDDIRYYIRDQKLTEPQTIFFSPRLNQEILFVPVPRVAPLSKSS